MEGTHVRLGAELCKKYMPADASTTGYVCLDKNSTRFLECYMDEVAVIDNCAPGTICAFDVGKWITGDP